MGHFSVEISQLPGSVLSSNQQVVGWFVTLALVGMTQGLSSSLWGASLPEAYGTRPPPARCGRSQRRSWWCPPPSGRG